MIELPQGLSHTHTHRKTRLFFIVILHRVRSYPGLDSRSNSDQDRPRTRNGSRRITESCRGVFRWHDTNPDGMGG